MSLVLYPRAAPSDRLRVWVGAFQMTHAPALSWFLNDAPAIPKYWHEYYEEQKKTALSGFYDDRHHIQ